MKVDLSLLKIPILKLLLSMLIRTKQCVEGIEEYQHGFTGLFLNVNVKNSCF